jgi:hypothetical protein
MATIDTSGIDVLYPIAGVDNDSQGFRDNFTAIKTAVESAVGIETVQTVTNKTLTSPTITNPTVTGTLALDTAAVIQFEGSVANAYETQLSVVNPTADRIILLPDADGTVSVVNSVTGAMGYNTGVGGTVTQGTGKSTGVTLNKTCGRIVLMNSALASDTSVSFTLTNSVIVDTDVVLTSIKGGVTTGGSYVVVVDEVSTGNCRISVRNVTSGSLSEAVQINFIVIKSVIA